MPFVNVRIAGHDIAATCSAIAEGMTTLMVDVLGKRAEATSVLVEPVSLGIWTIGRERPEVAAYVDVKITAGTNSSIEKQEFLRQAGDLMKRAMGTELSVYSYIVIHELAPSDWGYDGISQGERKAMRLSI